MHVGPWRGHGRSAWCTKQEIYWMWTHCWVGQVLFIIYFLSISSTCFVQWIHTSHHRAIPSSLPLTILPFMFIQDIVAHVHCGTIQLEHDGVWFFTGTVKGGLKFTEYAIVGQFIKLSLMERGRGWEIELGQCHYRGWEPKRCQEPEELRILDTYFRSKWALISLDTYFRWHLGFLWRAAIFHLIGRVRLSLHWHRN